MFVEAALAGIIIGYIRGGRLSNLKGLPINHFWAVFVAFVLQFSLRWLPDVSVYWRVLLHLLSYLFIFVFVLVNFKPSGMKIIGLGVLLNFLVIAANHGAMPVSAAGMSREVVQQLQAGGDGIHSLLTEQARLAFLADIIKIKNPVHGKVSWFSIGDLIMDLGIVVLIGGYMVSKVSYYKVVSVKRRQKS